MSRATESVCTTLSSSENQIKSYAIFTRSTRDVNKSSVNGYHSTFRDRNNIMRGAAHRFTWTSVRVTTVGTRNADRAGFRRLVGNGGARNKIKRNVHGYNNIFPLCAYLIRSQPTTAVDEQQYYEHITSCIPLGSP